jgi:hypothetical protein
VKTEWGEKRRSEDFTKEKGIKTRVIFLMGINSEMAEEEEKKYWREL